MMAAYVSSALPENPDPRTWAVAFLVLALFIAVAAPPRRGPDTLRQTSLSRVVRAWGLRLAYALPSVAFGALLADRRGSGSPARAAGRGPVAGARRRPPRGLSLDARRGLARGPPGAPTCDPGEADAAGLDRAVRRMQRSTLLAVPVWLACWVAGQPALGDAHWAIIGVMLASSLVRLAEQRAAVAAETSPWAAVVEAPTCRRRFFGLVALHALTATLAPSRPKRNPSTPGGA